MYLCSWSGGKDSCLACWKAIQAGYKISHLVNFISEEFQRVSFHGTAAKLIKMQSEAIGIPLLQKAVNPYDYEPAFKAGVNSVKTAETRGMVFGDIYLQEHKQWVERVCHELDIKAVEMLWGMRTEDILNEFIDNGFEAVIVSARNPSAHKDYGIDKEWIGQIVSKEFIRYLKKDKPYIDICGESGKYHTFVINGPFFHKKIVIKEKEVIERDTPYGQWFFLDMKT